MLMTKRILGIQSPSRQLMGVYDKFEKKKIKKKKLEVNKSFHQLLENEQNKLDNLKQ